MRYFFAFISIAALALCCSCGGYVSTPFTTYSSSTANSAASIVITPGGANVPSGSTRQFTATVVGLASTVVVWTVQEGTAGGTIDSAGNYTAPLALGTYHIIAKSQVDASVSATITINVFRPGEAQGVYAGTYSYGSAFYAIILPNDTFYSIEGSVADDGAMNHVYRLGWAEGMSVVGKYSATVQYSLMDGGFTSFFQATYVPATSLAGSISNATFTATAVPPARLDFSAPADLSHITGSWTGVFLEDMLGEPVTGTVMIGPAGEITSSDCYSGTVTPDANKNFFRVKITVAQGCNPANQTFSGVAMEMLQPDGVSRQLLIVTSTGYFGFAAVR